MRQQVLPTAPALESSNNDRHVLPVALFAPPASRVLSSAPASATVPSSGSVNCTFLRNLQQQERIAPFVLQPPFALPRTVPSPGSVNCTFLRNLQQQEGSPVCASAAFRATPRTLSRHEARSCRCGNGENRK
mmetsp:Transcript_15589/g.33702  ORF Transcript_15589/g.33702 Transcript_15589/m.33702 type:complete len:132 (+) Transcript_15589:1044-1439(+)